MAPIKKRTSMRARTSTSKPTAKSTTSATISALSASDLSALKLKKQDKRHLKHAALMHKVRDASVSKSSSTKKRRRPGNKMQAAESWGGLRDALPEEEEEEDDEEWEGLSEDGEVGVAGKKRARRRDGQGKIKMRSLQHRPGAMKRKAVLERREQERFGKNLAQLAANEGEGKDGKEGGEGDGVDGGGGGQAGKWAALRAFIGGTMEREKAFGKV